MLFRSAEARAGLRAADVGVEAGADGGEAVIEPIARVRRRTTVAHDLTGQTGQTDALRRHFPQAARLLACGGGTLNAALMRRLGEAIAPVPLDTTAACGIDPQEVEAGAFAWLARQALLQRSGNLPVVTGARGARVLGTIYPP